MFVSPRSLAVVGLLAGCMILMLLSQVSQQQAKLDQLEATLSRHTAAIGGANAQVASLAQTVARAQQSARPTVAQQHAPMPPTPTPTPPPTPAPPTVAPAPPPAPPVAGLDGCPPGGPPDPTCTRIQRKTWSESWSAVPAEDKETWKQLDCGCKLRTRPKTGMPDRCSRLEPGWDVKAQAQVRSLKNKYAGERCVLVANGPSLNKIRWDWQDNFKVIMGMNKIYIGLERYNISHLEAYAVANPLVVQQSVEQIVTALPAETEKFITINGGTKELYPCDSTEKNIYYVKSGTQKNFYHDITESPPMMMNEGYTVTHYSLQALYYLGCQTVYIVGMDHSFQQSGGPNQKQLMKGEDPNHFDPSYFQGHEWHTADLRNNERYYGFARAEYERDGRKIIDATLDGKCQVFEKADYLDVLYRKS